ncbi:MAG: hypothetical protein Q9160_007607 [Pyrenula sp. 1 TL-2023]
MSSTGFRPDKSEEPDKDWFKIPSNILDVTNPRLRQITPRNPEKGLLSLPNETLLNVYTFLYKDEPNNQPTTYDSVSPLCLALTCKRLAGVAMMCRFLNLLTGKRVVEPGSDASTFIQLLAEGWKRDRGLEICQVSGRFAPDTCRIGPCFCDSVDVCPFREIEFPGNGFGLQHIDEDEPLCIHCLRTRISALNVARSWLSERISWDGRRFSIDEDYHDTNSDLWYDALEDVQSSEKAKGHTVYI